MSNLKKLSIIIPCYNEEATISTILEEVLAVDLGVIQKEIIIVDDFSKDKTRKILQDLAVKHETIQLIFQNHNQGKGAALKRGILGSTGDVVVIQDADMEYDPQDYKRLLRPIERGRADVVYGSRFKGGEAHRIIYGRNKMANKFLTGLSNMFSGLKLSDMETCYKMFRGDLARTIAVDLQAKRFGFEPEVTARVAKSKVAICEVGISYYGRTKEEGKKIGMKDGLRAIWEIIRFNVLAKPSSNEPLKINPDKDMRILIASHYFPPHVGGMQIVAQQQAKHLVKNGATVNVITSHCAGKPGKTKHQDGYYVHRVRALNVFENKMGVPFPIFSPAIFWKTYRLVKKADIVHVHDAFYISSFVAAFWARMLRKPLFLTQHVAMIPHPNSFVMFAQNAVYRTTADFIFRTSDKIIVFNGRVKNFLINRHVPEEKIASVTNGVDFKLFHPTDPTQKLELRRKYKLPEEKTLALFVGRFVPKKGFHKLLKAASDDYTIVFAGGHRPSSQKPNDRLVFLGSISQQETAEVYRACDIFILPSEGEGFPLSIQEAMASGLPIITSHDEGYALYKFDEELFHFINPTIKQIKTHLELLHSNYKLRSEMSKYSLAYAKNHFDWHESVNELRGLYSETTA